MQQAANSPAAATGAGNPVAACVGRGGSRRARSNSERGGRGGGARLRRKVARRARMRCVAHVGRHRRSGPPGGTVDGGSDGSSGRQHRQQRWGAGGSGGSGDGGDRGGPPRRRLPPPPTRRAGHGGQRHRCRRGGPRTPRAEARPDRSGCGRWGLAPARVRGVIPRGTRARVSAACTPVHVLAAAPRHGWLRLAEHVSWNIGVAPACHSASLDPRIWAPVGGLLAVGRQLGRKKQSDKHQPTEALFLHVLAELPQREDGRSCQTHGVKGKYATPMSAKPPASHHRRQRSGAPSGYTLISPRLSLAPSPLPKNAAVVDGPYLTLPLARNALMSPLALLYPAA